MKVGPEGATYRSTNGMVVSIDHLASSAGLDILRRGGSAVDAAIATNAVLTVTCQHMCGLGGDLLAIVHPGDTSPPHGLNASGRAGSGASAVQLRDEGHRVMPFRGDIRSVTVPGCVDGWAKLHDRYGRLAFSDLFTSAIHYAQSGFPASRTLVDAAHTVRDVEGADVFRGSSGSGLVEGELVRRTAIAELLRDIASGGRQSWYAGRFGESLVQMGKGLFTEADMVAESAEWVRPVSINVWETRLWTLPPNSQGYLTLAAAGVTSGLELPEEPDDPRWPHLLIEASKQVGVTRPTDLYDGADTDRLLDPVRLTRLSDRINDVASDLHMRVERGDTTCVCVVDGEGMAISLIQSNAAGFGAHLVVPGTGVFLHNRGLGFSLEPGHVAELTPGARPPHTLAPTMITLLDGQLHTVLGTMGGDRQPQILLQLVAALLVSNQQPGKALAAGRWGLSTGRARPGFGTWNRNGNLTVDLEANVPDSWIHGLANHGHRVRKCQSYDTDFGHAHMISVQNGVLAGASDPRAHTGSAAGW